VNFGGVIDSAAPMIQRANAKQRAVK
jgi:hypothetical protein